MASTASDQLPARTHLDDPGIQWHRDEKPDYTTVDTLFMKEKTRCHKAGSLEKIVEDLVKNFETDSSCKLRPEDWQTVDTENFSVSFNGGQKVTLQDNLDKWDRQLFLRDSPMYDAAKETEDSSRKLFKDAFKSGFAWELLELVSGPPVVSFTWRHWGKFEGPFRDTPPSGKTLEMYGSCVVKVTDQMKIQSMEIYCDPNPMLATLMDYKRPSGCPYVQKSD